MNKINEKLSIISTPIKDLIYSSYNPRVWSSESSRALAESIKRFGIVDPVIANSASNRKNIVIGGHFRLKIAKDLGFTEVPVLYVNIPDIEKEKELNLRLNRNTGEWDYDLLKAFDIDHLLDIGFDDSDLSHIWDENLEIEDDAFDVEKAIQETKNPVTKPGDVIVFDNGFHRLICGDSTDPSVVQRLVGEDKVSMLNFDYPYNIDLDYNRGVGSKANYGSKKVQDNKTPEAYKTFVDAVLKNGLKHIQPNAHIFCWCDQRYIGLFQSLYQENHIDHKRVCLWIKNSQNPTPQIAFNKSYEPCIYGTIGAPFLSGSIKNFNEVLNKEIGTGNRLADDVMDLFDIWLVKRLHSNEYEHPTQKPPTVYEKALRRCSKPGDVVLDLFGGSGSTLIACEQLKRRAFLSEIDPVFCDVIVKRYKELTGKEVSYEHSNK